MIDFTSIIKGQRAARQDNDRDLATRRAEEKFAFERDQRMIGLETQQWDRQAASYAAPLLSNMQQAADAGQDDVTFLINQRNVVRADPAFQGFAPEVQQRVLKQLGEAAQITAQQRIQAGDPTAARKLYQAFGWQGQIPTLSVAGQSGDIKAIIQSVDPNGTMLVPNPDGSYSYNGVSIPADRLAAALQAGGGAAALPAISATIQAENARITQATQQQQQNQLMLYQQSAMAAGFLPQPDGTFVNPTTGAVYPPMPGLTPAATDVIQLPGNTLGPQVAAPVGGVVPVAAPAPAPVAAGLIPAVPGAAPVVAAPAAVVAPPKWQTDLPAIYTAAQTADTAAAQKTAEKQRIEARLNELAPWVMPPSRAMNDGATPRRVPKREEDRAEVNRLLASLEETKKGEEKNIAEGKLKRLEAGALESELAAAVVSTDLAAPWVAPLIESAVTAGASLESARAAAKSSPVVVKSQLELIKRRLTELYGKPDKASQEELVRLILARDNLEAARKGGR